ncbi:hypothetical protein DPM19_06085 [Actinomadura craniellae]|uniref:Uncharacterized protein n=1 Tax=Actinomadura craniellae TaxID=2231787 RepID=A0A365HBM4_9ACTN|nr:hypothetical protein [Actinomadura craniellae]RAY16439.1 hypothetical protein DPM19_06085 [Actinomadura craniellae]
MADQRLHRSVPDRARRRAIRAYAARAGVPYSVAARRLALGPGETLADAGRTVHPASPGRDGFLDRRPVEERLLDARRAAEPPRGRAAHLTDRFPPLAGTPFYRGAGRRDALALLYTVVAHEVPGRLPSAAELAPVAGLGEETAVDIACAELDRAARLLLDDLPTGLTDGTGAPGPRIEAALAGGRAHPDPRLREAARSLTAAHGTGPALAGARQILDALLVVADDGHAPGTRVRTLGGRTGAIAGAVWGPYGPPLRYEVLSDDGPARGFADPGDLVVIAPV